MNPATNDDADCLLAAASSGHADDVRVLTRMSAGANDNAQRNDGVSALHVASRTGRTDIVKLLLENGADIETRDINGCTPLWIAAANGHGEVIETLIASGADADAISYNRYLPFHAAIENGYTDAAVTLLELDNSTKLADIYYCSLLRFMTEVFKGSEKQILSLVRRLRKSGTEGCLAKCGH